MIVLRAGGGSNGHFNHVDPTRGQRFFSIESGFTLESKTEGTPKSSDLIG